MQACGLAPNLVSYGICMDACAKAGLWEKVGSRNFVDVTNINTTLRLEIRLSAFALWGGACAIELIRQKHRNNFSREVNPKLDIVAGFARGVDYARSPLVLFLLEWLPAS